MAGNLPGNGEWKRGIYGEFPDFRKIGEFPEKIAFPGNGEYATKSTTNAQILLSNFGPVYWFNIDWYPHNKNSINDFDAHCLNARSSMMTSYFLKATMPCYNYYLNSLDNSAGDNDLCYVYCDAPLTIYINYYSYHLPVVILHELYW